LLKIFETMDLQTRKLNLISYLAQMQDTHFFDQIENYILRKEIKEFESEIKPFTNIELTKRIEKSENDFENGNYKSMSELENISSNW